MRRARPWTRSSRAAGARARDPGSPVGRRRRPAGAVAPAASRRSPAMPRGRASRRAPAPRTVGATCAGPSSGTVKFSTCDGRTSSRERIACGPCGSATAIVLLIVMFASPRARRARKPRAAKRLARVRLLLRADRLRPGARPPRRAARGPRADAAERERDRAERRGGAGRRRRAGRHLADQHAGGRASTSPTSSRPTGDVIWALEGGRLNAVDARAARPRLLVVARLQVARARRAAPLRRPHARARERVPRGRTLTQVDVSDPAKPVVMRTEMSRAISSTRGSRAARRGSWSSRRRTRSPRCGCARARRAAVPQRRVVNAARAASRSAG